MKWSRMLAMVLVAGVVCSSLSCRFRRGGDDGGNGGGDGGGNGNDVGLTVQQQAAVEAVASQLEATARAVTSVADSLQGLDAENDLQLGDCPVVAADVMNGTISVAVDFPDGCTNDYYGDDVALSGGASIAFTVADRSVTVTFNDFSDGDQTVSGDLNVQLTREDLRRTLTGDIDIATTGVGTAVGQLEIEYDSARARITIHDADLALTDPDAVSYSVEMDGLVIEPIDNGSFIPESGTVTFQVPAETPGGDPVTIVVEFDSQSPVDGTVSVTVGELPAVQYTLVGID